MKNNFLPQDIQRMNRRLRWYGNLLSSLCIVLAALIHIASGPYSKVGSLLTILLGGTFVFIMVITHLMIKTNIQSHSETRNN